jgi:hypothetical protein
LRQNLKRGAIFACDVVSPFPGRAIACFRRPVAPGPAQIRVLPDLGQTQEIESRFLVFRVLGLLSRQRQPCRSHQRITIARHGKTLSGGRAGSTTLQSAATAKFLAGRPNQISEIFFCGTRPLRDGPAPIATPGCFPDHTRGPVALLFRPAAPDRPACRRRPCARSPQRLSRPLSVGTSTWCSANAVARILDERVWIIPRQQMVQTIAWFRSLPFAYLTLERIVNCSSSPPFFLHSEAFGV